MKKLLVLSGKGGTGKTTVASAFISFSRAKAFADCDVDAPNLHLVNGFGEDGGEAEPFWGMDKAYIDPAACVSCGKCAKLCRFSAIGFDLTCNRYYVNEIECEGCGLCEVICPERAVSMRPCEAGTLRLHKGERVFSTAKLKMGSGNSGKLVAKVKKQLDENLPPDAETEILDGSPGIGCPVIASMSGADLLLLVAEPSVSGISDLKRIAETAEHFDLPACVIVNRFDISPENTHEIEEFCREKGMDFLGKIPYDKKVPEAVNSGKSIADFDCPARDALYAVWIELSEKLKSLT